MTNSHSGSGSARVESTEEPFRTWMRYHMQSEDESDSVTNSRHTTRSVTATPEHATGGTHLAGWDGGDGYCRLAPYLHSTPGHDAIDATRLGCRRAQNLPSRSSVSTATHSLSSAGLEFQNMRADYNPPDDGCLVVGSGQQAANAISSNFPRGVSRAAELAVPVSDGSNMTCIRTWYLEILSIIVAVCSFASITTILAMYQGKPKPQWPHLVSINSLIAVFSGILKAALVMPVTEGESCVLPS